MLRAWDPYLRMKTSKKIVVGAVAVFLAAAVLFGASRYREFRIRRHVSTQLSNGLPQKRPRDDGGGSFNFKRVEILACQRSADGKRYDIKFQVWYDGMVIESGVLLLRDEWGKYRGEWHDRSNKVSFAVE
jgi:hypothetical protein